MSSDERYMNRCLELAQKGIGHVAPNPLVGAVIVHKNQIIGEGYHECYGEAHAEVNAVNSVAEKSLLAESTIYVSLEPCAHFGKTPPCADLIVQHQFKRVVIGSLDSHSKVSGKGIERIKNAGIEVETGILEQECRALNRPFFTFHEQKRPYVVLKWATTPNNLIDKANGKEGEVTWISRPETQVFVHQLRNEYQAILIGTNTALADDPSLTVRTVEGTNPIRVLLDRTLRVPDDARIFDNSAPTIVLNGEIEEQKEHVQFLKTDDFSPNAILNTLYEQSIQSVLIEGGAQTLQSFIDDNLWDEAYRITGNNSWEEGTVGPTIQGTLETEFEHFGDKITHLKRS